MTEEQKRVPEKLTTLLGALREPFETECNKRGMTPSQLNRLFIAQGLGIDSPEMPRGNPDALSALELANKKNPKHRTQKKRRRRN